MLANLGTLHLYQVNTFTKIFYRYMKTKNIDTVNIYSKKLFVLKLILVKIFM